MTPSEWLTAALVVITGFYAYATFKILAANQEAARAMERQVDASLRPYVVVTVLTEPLSSVLYLRIANEGKTAAENLRLTISRDFYRHGVRGDDHNLARYPAFQQEFRSFPPGSELVFELAQSFVVFGEKADPATTPSEFQVVARYRSGSKMIDEMTDIGLRQYLNSSPRPDALAKQVKEARESVEKIVHPSLEKIFQAIKTSKGA